MNPTRVFAENYRTYERLDVALPVGCTAVVGPNGSGKSSIVNLPELCLFGPANRQLAPYLADHAEAGELVIGMEFEHRGNDYRIRRRYSPAGRGKTTLDFEEWIEDEDRWAPLTRSSMAETQALIEQTVGLSRDTLRASAFLAQGDGAAFTEALPARRKEILAEVLGLGIWDELAKRARVRLTLAQGLQTETRLARDRALEGAAKLPELRGSLEMDSGALALVEERIARVGNELEAAREAYNEARLQLASTDGAKAELRVCEERLAAAERDVRAYQEAQGGIASHQEALRAAREAAEPLAALELQMEAEKGVLDGHRLKVSERARWNDQVRLNEAAINETSGFAQVVIAKIKATEAGTAALCESCGQPLDDQARALTLKRLRAELDGHHAALERLRHEQISIEKVEDPGDPPGREKIDELAGQIGTARAAARDLAILEERVAGLERVPAPEPGAVEAAREAVIEQGRIVEELATQTRGIDLEALKAAGEKLAVSLRTLENERTALGRTIAASEARLAIALEDERAVVVETEALERLGEQIALYELAVRAYSRDGVPALIVESVAVPQIETEANRILPALGTDYQVELRTQRETKSGSISEALDIVVTTPAGERPYETFSGGERTRLNLSLRIALARLLAHRRGAEVKLLAIDEPEFLDEDGVELLSEVLLGLASDFERIILISHMPALRESFPQALVVVKDGDRSRVEGQDGNLGGAA